MPSRRFANILPFRLRRQDRPARNRPVPGGGRSARPAFSPLVFLLIACLLAPPAASPQGTPAQKKKTVVFGVIPRFNPHVMYEYYQPLMDYLSRKTPYEFRLRVGRSYMEAIESLGNGTSDVAYLGGATFSLARHRFGARALVKPRNPEGEATYRCYIIVREDSRIRTLHDLKGKSLAYGARRATTGSLIPSYMLAEAGFAMNLLKEIKNFPHHEDVAKAVLKGTFDAGAVKDVVAWRYRTKGLRAIATSEELPNAPIAAGASLPKDVEEAMVSALLAIDAESPDGRELLAGFGPELQYGFVPARDEDYDFLYRKIISIPKGCGKGCHAKNPFLER